jgi:Arc/MetJ-type ribon-helix-helix transcriptional regulator
MRVIIDSDIEKLLRATVERGEYASADEVVREALLSFLKLDSRTRARLHGLRRELSKGLSDVREGRIAEFDPKAIKARARQQLTPAREK